MVDIVYNKFVLLLYVIAFLVPKVALAPELVAAESAEKRDGVFFKEFFDAVVPCLFFVCVFLDVFVLFVEVDCTRDANKDLHELEPYLKFDCVVPVCDFSEINFAEVDIQVSKL